MTGRRNGRGFRRGERAVFIYQCEESEESSDVELWFRTVRPVVVIRRLHDGEEVNEADVGRMYMVRFDDGFEADVLEDELVARTNVISPTEVRRTNPPRFGPDFRWLSNMGLLSRVIGKHLDKPGRII